MVGWDMFYLEISTRVWMKKRNHSNAHTTEVAKVAFEFAAPFYTWEQRGLLYVFGGFGGWFVRGLSQPWGAASVRIIDVLDVGQSPCISPVDVMSSSKTSRKTW
jgi:hypothetical protein